MDHHTILSSLTHRYATKVYDPTAIIAPEDLQLIIESGRLAPSSIGLEPWKILHIQNPALREALQGAAYGQTQVTEAHTLLVLARRTDAAALPGELVERTALAQHKTPEDLAGLRAMAEGGISRPDSDAWLARQLFLPLGFMLYTAALLQVDATPMEGFDPTAVDQILSLPERGLTAQVLLTLGKRGEDKYANLPKTRRPLSEMYEIIA